MSRYINADRAIESLFDYCNGKKTIGQCIDDTPTEDVKPIVYGEWLIHKAYQGGIEEEWFQCSKCGWENALLIPRNFCPKCGTTMKKKSEEEE